MMARNSKSENSDIFIIGNNKTNIDQLTLLLPTAVIINIDIITDPTIYLPAIQNIVLLDMALVGSGNLIQTLKSQNGRPEVIVFSETFESGACISAYRYGASHFFELPIRKVELDYILKLVNETSSCLHMVEDTVFKALLPQQQMNSNNEDPERRIQAVKKVIDLVPEIDGWELLAFCPVHKLRDLKPLILSELGKTVFKQIIANMPTVLCVEDEKEFRDTVKSSLQDASCNVVEAGCADEALLLTDKVTEIDVILLDIGMPGLSGVELAPMLQKQYPNAKIIMLTAFDSIEYVVNSFKSKVVDFLIKPSSQDELLLKVSTAYQRACFERALQSSLKSFIGELVPRDTKITVLSEIARRRHAVGNMFIMADVYLFFPHLKASGIPDDQEIYFKIFNSGMGLFIEVVDYQIQYKIDWKEVIHHWDRLLVVYSRL